MSISREVQEIKFFQRHSWRRLWELVIIFPGSMWAPARRTRFLRLTNSMKRKFASTSRSAGKEIPRPVWNLKLHFLVHKMRSVVPFPSQDEFSPHPHYLRSILIICWHVTSCFSKRSLSFKIFKRSCVEIFFPCNLHFPFISFLVTWSKVCLVKNTLNESLPHPVTYVSARVLRPSLFFT